MEQISASCYMLKHPDKVLAYIGVGQVVSAEEGETCSYQDALQKAEAAGDDPSAMQRAYKKYLRDRTTTSLLE